MACFIIALVFGILPAKVKGCGQNPTFMGLANAFSGGLFLAISLYHILPDVVEEYDTWKTENEFNSKLPLPYMLCFFGYVFILLIDRVMFDSHTLFGDDHGHGHGHGDSHGQTQEHTHILKSSNINDDVSIVESERHGEHSQLGNDPAGQKLISNLKKSMSTNLDGSVKRSFI